MPERVLANALQAPVYEVAQETPFQAAPNLSRRLNNQVYLKREDLQQVFSFKLRGAYNRMKNLSEHECQLGVICASAGNHAQGVALASRKLGINAEIVMPQTTPPIKVQSVKRLGGTVILQGDTYDEAYAFAAQRATETGRIFVHPYDDPYVIAGQGTLALEILRQHPKPLDAIFIPVGGGGLIAGVASVIKQVWPQTKIIGVEPADAACLTAALAAKERVILPSVGIYADGVAVKQAGRLPFEIALKTVDEMVTNSVDEIAAAIKDVFEDTRAIAEPAGALAVAGLKKYVSEHPECVNKALGVIISGANMNFDRLRDVVERTEIGEQREALFAVTIAEKPGEFKRFCELLGDRRNVTEFNYRFSDPKAAQIFVGIGLTQGREEREAILALLAAQSFAAVDLTDNEMAKSHLRYMVGGRALGVENERLYRFEFPERPGALLKFLNLMSEDWNISLFHYRNHGAAEGRVLAGIQVPQDELPAFDAYLLKLGYPFHCESDNPAYLRFLQPL